MSGVAVPPQASQAKAEPSLSQHPGVPGKVQVDGGFVFRVRRPATSKQPATWTAAAPLASSVPPAPTASVLDTPHGQDGEVLPTQPLQAALPETQPLGTVLLPTQPLAPAAAAPLPLRPGMPARTARTGTVTMNAPAQEPRVESVPAKVDRRLGSSQESDQYPAAEPATMEEPMQRINVHAAIAPSTQTLATPLAAPPACLSTPSAGGDVVPHSSLGTSQLTPQHLSSRGQTEQAGRQDVSMEDAAEGCGGDSGAAEGLALAGQAPPTSPTVCTAGVADEASIEERVRHLLPCLPKGCPAAVGFTWLLEEALSLAVPSADAEAADTAEAIVQLFRQGLEERANAARRLLLGGDAAQVAEFDRLPAVVRNMCSEARLAADLRRQLAALEAEEQSWLALEAQYSSCSAVAMDTVPGTPNVSVNNPADEPGEKAASSGPAPAAPLPNADFEGLSAGAAALPLDRLLEDLRTAQQRADFELELQVAALENFVTKAELRLVRAEQTCSLLQAAYHEMTFKDYEGADKPHLLVQFLSQNPAPIDFVPSTQPSQQLV